MRVKLALLVLFSIAAVGLPARADAASDWVVATYTGGPGGASNTWLGLRVAGQTGVDTSVLGFGFSWEDFRYVDVFSASGGPIAITTTKDGGAYDVELQPGVSGSFSGSSTADGFSLAEGESLSFVMFAAGGAFDSVSVIPAPPGATLDVQTGSGSQAILAADPKDTGVAVGTRGTAVGTSTHVSSVASGIVGSFVSSGFCTLCQGTWSGPGTAGSAVIAEAATPVLSAGTSNGSTTFGGSAGEWQWTFTGAAIPSGVWSAFGGPVYAAYAPIGDAWTLFV